MRHNSLIAIFAITILIGMGCSSENSERETRGQILHVEPIWYTGAYAQCNEDDADFFIDVSLTAPTYLETLPLRIPVCAADNFVDDGIYGTDYFCAASSHGGVGGTVRIDTSTSDRIDIHFHLSLSNESAYLEVNEIVHVHLQALRGEYSANGCSIKWSIVSRDH